MQDPDLIALWQRTMGTRLDALDVAPDATLKPPVTVATGAPVPELTAITLSGGRAGATPWAGCVTARTMDGAAVEPPLDATRATAQAGQPGAGTLSDEATIDTPVADPAAATTPPQAPAGTQAFDLKDEVGRGGMGVVYRGRQRSLARDVAIKVILPEQRSPQAEARFLAEAMVNAALDHPNIVPVHELARDQDGAVFLAMKLVGGYSWRRLLHPRDDAERAAAAVYDLEGHLGILQSVANAVAFAHSKGIVHRDLKPENVMVGGFGEVLVMDWGIAVDIRERADVDLRAQHKSTVTSPSGSPSYMPPELAHGRGQEIGPWTDTYLLGAILHEILTGRPPHRGGNLTEVILAASRSAPPEFAADISTGLAQICRRALARLPADRYQSVADLQEALRTHLKHRASERIGASAAAVLARATADAGGDAATRRLRYGDYADAVAGFRQALVLWPDNATAAAGERQARLAYAGAALAGEDLGLAETQLQALSGDDDAGSRALRATVATARSTAGQAARQARLNRRALAGAVIAIVAGLAVGVALLAHAKRLQQDEVAQTARERDLALSERRHAEQLTSFMLHDLSGKLQAIGRVAVLGDVVRQARDYYRSRQASAGEAGDTAVQANLAIALENLAQVLRAQGDLGGALAVARDCLALRKGLADAQPGDAQPAIDEARLLGLVGETQRDLGALTSADAAYQEALTLLRARIVGHQDQADWQAQLADALDGDAAIQQARGDLTAAGTAYRDALAIRERFLAGAGKGEARWQAGVATSHELLAEIERRMGRVGEASTRLERALALRLGLAQRDATDLGAQAALARCHERIANALRLKGQTEAALAAADSALALRLQLVARDPDNAQWQSDLAELRGHLAELHDDHGDAEATAADLVACQAIRSRLARQDPNNLAWQHALIEADDHLGDQRLLANDEAGALAIFLANLAARRGLCAKVPGNATWEHDLIDTLDRVGDLRLHRHELGEAETVITECAALAERLAQRDPANEDWRRDRAIAATKVGDLRQAQGRMAEAAARFAEFIAIHEQLATSDPGNVIWLRELAISYDRSGQLHLARGEVDEARRDVTHEVELLGPVAEQHPDNATFQRDLAGAWESLAGILRRDPTRAEALRDQANGVDIRRRLVARLPANRQFQRELAFALEWMAAYSVEADAQGGGEGAGALRRQALALRRALVAADPARVTWGCDLATSLAASGTPEDAAEAQVLWEQLGASAPADHEVRTGLAASLQRQATASGVGMTASDAAERDRVFATATATARRAVELRQALSAEQPQDRDQLDALGSAWNALGKLQYEWGHHAEALVSFGGFRAANAALLAQVPGNETWLHDQSVAAFNAANAAEQAHDYVRAKAAYADAAASVGADPATISSYAWFLLNCSDETQRDLPAGLEAAQKADAKAKHQNSDILDTLAWALFVNNRAREALANGELALELMSADAAEGDRASMKRRLQKYRDALKPPQ